MNRFRRLPRNRKEKDLTVTCGHHGPSVWHGTVACSNCAAPYQLLYPDEPLFAGVGEICACGALLTKDGSGAEYSARTACGRCWKRLIEGRLD